MDKCTPGPWHTDGNLIRHDHDIIGTSNRPEDAALIAAAPELLEALRNLVKAHEVGVDEVINAKLDAIELLSRFGDPS